MEQKWISEAEAEKELKNLRMLVCSANFGGMDDFSKERSHLLKLAYVCLRTTKFDFGECQQLAWDEYKKMKKDECNKEV